MSEPKTTYFANCIGVFEGGGVRASAFAGAFEAASKAGIGFSEVAGTSAGSIAAALIATGAGANEVSSCLRELDFKSLLAPIQVKDRIVRSHWLAKLAFKCSRVMWGNQRRRWAALANAGTYSSEEIENWVNHQLITMLKAQERELKNGTVCFKDLLMPLSVVATDLTNKTYKVWSDRDTPNDSVAAAVRASCSIPFFFQPAQVGGSVYVDGGMLSNLPSFLFYGRGEGETQYSTRVLSFRLKSASLAKRHPLASSESFIHALGDTVVDGATTIQSRLLPRHYAVDIDTESVRATDFEKMTAEIRDKLHDNGIRDVTAFVRKEQTLVQITPTNITYSGRDQTMLLYVESIKNARDSILICDETSDWLYLLFPTFLAAAFRNLSITYLTKTLDEGGPKIERDLREEHRRELLRGLGARVICIDRDSKLPFVGFFTDPNGTGVAAITKDREKFLMQSTRTYSSHRDSWVFSNMVSAALQCGHTLATNKQGQVRPKLAPANESEIFDRLRRIPAYRNAKFSVRRIQVNAHLQSTQNHIKEFKYLQINDLVETFKDHKIQFFSAYDAKLNNGLSTLITPPVIEIHNNQPYVIEGNTRSLFCLRAGIIEIDAIAVENVSIALPTKPRPLNSLTIRDTTVDLNDQFQFTNQSAWRNIEEEVHPLPGC